MEYARRKGESDTGTPLHGENVHPGLSCNWLAVTDHAGERTGEPSTVGESESRVGVGWQAGLVGNILQPMMPAESEDNYDCPSTSRHLQASVFQFALRVCSAETWALAPAARPENNKRSKSWKIYGTKETDTGGFKRQLEACGRTCSCLESCRCRP